MAENKPVPSIFVPDAELSLIKGAFFENSVLLKALRNLLLGLDLDSSEKKLVSSLSPEVKAVVRKRFFPIISKETPPGQLIDLWTGLDLVGKSPIEIQQTIEVRNRMIDMTKMGLDLMDNHNGKRPDVGYEGKNDELGIMLTSRNRFIGHIEFQTRMLEVVAGQKNETESEKGKKAVLNSSK